MNAVTNGASNLSGPVAPGEVIVIYGSGLGPAQLAQFQADANGLVPTSVGGTSVYFNGVAGAGAVRFGEPGGGGGALRHQRIARPDVRAESEPDVGPVQPLGGQPDSGHLHAEGSGTGQAAAINNKDGSINGAGHPAKVGDYVQLYITGVGQTNPAGTDGLINAAPLPVPVAPVKVTIGGQTATVNFAGGAPGTVAGVIQVNAQIPSGITAGAAVPVVVQVGTSNSQPNVTIAVTN